MGFRWIAMLLAGGPAFAIVRGHEFLPLDDFIALNRRDTLPATLTQGANASK